MHCGAPTGFRSRNDESRIRTRGAPRHRAMSTTPEPASPVIAQDAPASIPPRRVSMGTHYLRYSTANALVLLAGLISFPALTRLLDNTQYGILGYYETWVMMAVAIAKLGAQQDRKSVVSGK